MEEWTLFFLFTILHSFWSEKAGQSEHNGCSVFMYLWIDSVFSGLDCYLKMYVDHSVSNMKKSGENWSGPGLIWKSLLSRHSCPKKLSLSILPASGRRFVRKMMMGQTRMQKAVSWTSVVVL